MGTGSAVLLFLLYWLLILSVVLWILRGLPARRRGPQGR